MRNYVCPKCSRAKRAPERMSADDVRRYCLSCSMETGKLVRRSAPALDAARERKATKAKTVRERAARAERSAKAAAARKREMRIARDDARAVEAAREKRTVAGLDLDIEARRLWDLDAFRTAPARRRQDRALPGISYRRTGLRWKSHTSGSIGWGRGIVVTIGAGFDGGAIETLLHELCHASVGLSRGHDEVFWSTLRRAAREAWPTTDFKFHEGTANESGWKLDERIGRGIQRWLDGRSSEEK